MFPTSSCVGASRACFLLYCPHIGHIYTNTIADIIARYRRMMGDEVFLLTGTDEHAAKVVDAAAERDLAPMAWADHNAGIFKDTFASYGIDNDDFIRTTEPRHTERVRAYLAALLETGDVYPGTYEGWYDVGQEEYVPESRAAALDFRSPITGRPLVRKHEHNYFFRLSAYAGPLLHLLAEQPDFVQPRARRNEVIARIEEGLNDIPISRTGTDWGISFPGSNQHKVYVWIDALFNYVSAVDTPERRHLWPADVHLIAKDILWFHAVIWPALLMALHRAPGFDWLELPRRVYAHGFWVSGGQKMSKSLSNFVDLERLERCVTAVGLDGLRYFLAAAGPLGIADRDFTEERLAEVYTADLANGFGNLVQRATSLVSRYAGGVMPEPGPPETPETALRAVSEALPAQVAEAFERLAVDEAAAHVMALVTAANRYAEETAPWQLARAGNNGRLATSLYHLTEAARLAAWYLQPVMPAAAAEAHRRLSGQEPEPCLGTFG
ncbi:MAG: methionine--tRNA ligase, partial [Chloroflexi bacterium]|nr:methionine--tRNA ligase [Chloroflexota bacterium]